MMKRIQNSKGFMSIEAIFGMSAILMVIVLGIGFFTYMMPRQALEQEINLLGRMAKMNGGLSSDDVNGFHKNLEKKGYKKEDIKLSLVLKDVNGNPQMAVVNGESVNPLGITCKANDAECDVPEDTQLYIKRNTQLIMEIRVEVPSNKKGLVGALSFFNANEKTVSDTYVFTERIMSERY